MTIHPEKPRPIVQLPIMAPSSSPKASLCDDDVGATQFDEKIDHSAHVEDTEVGNRLPNYTLSVADQKKTM